MSDISYLKDKIRYHNERYRAGEPEISDEEYDLMVEDCQRQMAPADFSAFLETLSDEGGDVVHPYAVGSLKKLKFGENQLLPWIKKQLISRLLIMCKIDGGSYVASYVDGVLVKGATKGRNGRGKDITAKLRLILPRRLPRLLTMDIRGEFTLIDDSFKALGFKNRRSGAIGLMKREDATPEEMSHVKAYAYQILSGHMADAPVADQLMELLGLGFSLPEFMPSVAINLISEEEIEARMAKILLEWKESVPYDMDGLVLCSMDYQVENTHIPEGMVSYKVNQDAVPTRVTGIDWRISKNGRLTPVIQIEPVEIDGSTVSQATCYNATWLSNKRAGVGAKIGILKSGEIIPKLTEVYEAADVELPKVCPSCSAVLTMNGVDLCCDNDSCGAVGVKEVESLLVKLEIEGAKAQTLENLGIRSMDDLLTWRPDTEYKSQTGLYDEILSKIFNAPADRLFAALLFDGMGRKLIGRLISFYGTRWEATSAVRTVAYGTIPEGFAYPEGFTALNISKVAESWERNLELLGRICADDRYREPAPEIPPMGGTFLAGKTFLITGTLSKPRKEIESLITANGGTLASGVSKKLDYLLAGEAAGSKLDKAKSLGVTIIDELSLATMLVEPDEPSQENESNTSTAELELEASTLVAATPVTYTQTSLF